MERPPTTCTRTTTSCTSRTADEDRRRPRLEVRRFDLQRLQKQQNFNADEESQLIFSPGWTPVPTSNAVGDILTGRVTQYNQGSRPPPGEFRIWNYDFFAQDSWKVRQNLTLELACAAATGRTTPSSTASAATSIPSLYDPTKGLLSRQHVFEDLTASATPRRHGARRAARQPHAVR